LSANIEACPDPNAPLVLKPTLALCILSIEAYPSSNYPKYCFLTALRP